MLFSYILPKLGKILRIRVKFGAEIPTSGSVTLE